MAEGNTTLVKASVSSVQMSPKKVSVVASLVRGRSVEDAITILEHTPRSAAKPLTKVIESAKANAENNHGLTSKSLVVNTLDIGQGPALKRYRPAARGRALPYKKRTTNIRVVLEGSKKPAKKKPAESKKSETDKSEKAKKEEQK